ncbi:MAG: hypothetical protein V1740_04230 [Candidatus Woesearchaeota archaeon]
MKQIVFVKKVSKGTRFNQIYVPKDMENDVEVGDIVEVKLLKKHLMIYRKNVPALNEFKEYLVKNIFSMLNEFEWIESAFIIGSFLFETVYNDIDLVVISEKTSDEKADELEKKLTGRFSQKFHVQILTEDKLKKFVEKDLIMKSMFENFISNIDIQTDYKSILDKNHIEFMLMMPSDLLKIRLESRTFYKTIRRLVTIERGLKNKKLDRKEIVNETDKMIKNDLLEKIRNNKEINNDELRSLRDIIRKKINNIRNLMKDQ